MPAKDNDPKAPKAPAKRSAKTTAKKSAKVTPEAITSAAAPEIVEKKKTVRTRRVAAAPAASAPSETASSIGRPNDAGSSFEGEVRLRAYLLYAERGFRGGSPESDWFQAEREVAHGRQA